MSEQYGVGDASYRAAGGLEGLRRLVEDFYRFMDALPEAAEVRAMYPEELVVARDKLVCFLSGWLGGPKLFAEKYGSIAIPSFHAQWPIGPEQAEAWLVCMSRAVACQRYAPDFVDYLMAQLHAPAQRIVQASAARHAP
ncbi:group II truncated hemoglobin [Pseudomonas paralcaligenes]|uniref:group II truncated hemoglobin n=1 Tax=Pseudomonas paralcaligenes TaxID=2772558 RepID=UPI001C7FDB13|nr:group II truncated hemoglobin [Pseudomonas paralcaligenes]